MKKNLLIIITGLISALLIFGSAYYFYSKYNQTQKLLKNPKYAQKQEIKNLLNKVGKLIELPVGEEPTIAKVSDKDKLKNQPFFAKVQNGDEVLIYAKAKKAILYRPSTNKIIEVGPINIGESSPSASLSSNLSPTKSASVKIAIYNASKTAGLAASTEAKLKTEFNNISIVQKSNSQGDYEKTLVVDLGGQQKKLASDIATFLHGEVGSLPSTETKPSGDILVIVVE